MKPRTTSPCCSARLWIYCGRYVQPAQSHRPCFETSGCSHLEQGHGTVRPSRAEPLPWPTFPHKVPCSTLLPHLPSQQTVLWRASCLQAYGRPQDYQISRMTRPCIVGKRPPGSKYRSTSGLSPREHLERQAEFHASTQDEA